MHFNREENLCFLYFGLDRLGVSKTNAYFFRHESSSVCKASTYFVNPRNITFVMTYFNYYHNRSENIYQYYLNRYIFFENSLWRRERKDDSGDIGWLIQK